MEKLVRVLEQFPLETIELKNDRGEKKIMKKVTVKMTDGIDEFYGEALDSTAETIDHTPLSTEQLYGAQLRISCKERENNGKKTRWNSFRLLTITEV